MGVIVVVVGQDMVGMFVLLLILRSHQLHKEHAQAGSMLPALHAFGKQQKQPMTDLECCTGPALYLYT